MLPSSPRSRCFVAALVGAMLALGSADAAGPSRPNIVFILADDMGWGDMGVMGHREVLTPRLDALAAEGALFTQFYVMSAVCSPSRVGFLTGRFPGELGFHSVVDLAEQNERLGIPNWLDPAIPNAARLLKDAGYATAHYGKWHLGSLPGAPSVGNYGFDAHRSVLAPDGDPTWPRDESSHALSAEKVVDEAIAFIDEHREGPFFVQAWIPLPHSTLNPTPEQMKPYEEYAPPWPYQHPGTKQVYYASITAIDTAVGRLVDRIDELGLGDDTLILFSSDNGPEDIVIPSAVHSGIGSPGPFRGRKRSLYEGGIRTPLIARWPGKIAAGRVDDLSVVAAVDFLPTFLHLAGIPAPEGAELDGEDVSGILLGTPRARAKPLYWEWRLNVIGPVVDKSPLDAMRVGDWKLLLNPDLSRVELYDLRTDPGERQNLAEQRTDVVDLLAPQLLAWADGLPAGGTNLGAGTANYRWPRCPPGDDDLDGVRNCNDGCPTDPAKFGPGQCGCFAAEADDDGDGTSNCVDGCPSDPAKVEPGACGCFMSEADTDADGVPNCVDDCPLDAPDDADGDGVCESADRCPGLDDRLESDGDGIIDCLDICPSVADTLQRDGDFDGAGDACDCAPADPEVRPGGPEINDGRDNQCPGDTGYGAVDETSGNSGFVDPERPTTRYSWPPQAGASHYVVVRSRTPHFLVCAAVIRTEYWDDDDTPPRGRVFHYLNHAVAPLIGSWGLASDGSERPVPCGQ